MERVEPYFAAKELRRRVSAGESDLSSRGLAPPE
jgi:hypothetical protein